MIIYDARGNPWTFEGNSLYCHTAPENSPLWNGFVCHSWEEAIEILNDENFMNKECYPENYR